MTQAEMRIERRSGAVGLGENRTPARKLFGLFELDSAGTVLYMRVETDGARPLGGAADYRGYNFYTEVAPFRNVVELRNHIDDFSRGSQPAHSMDFTCDYEDGPVL